MLPLAPCHTADLFQPLHTELVSVLKSLAPADWLRPTVAPKWRVRDIAAHLLDGQLRRLSAQRDAHHRRISQRVTPARWSALDPVLRCPGSKSGQGIGLAVRAELAVRAAPI